jgi:hypothetical protein
MSWLKKLLGMGGNVMREQKPHGRIKAKVNMAGMKIHGENSPDVLSGRVPLGYTEPVGFDEPEQYIEMTYDETVERFGKNQADLLFKGVE